MSSIEISRCVPHDFQAALKVLHDGLSVDQQASLVQTLDLLRGSDESIFAGLLVAKSDDHLIAATWIQFTPGEAAVIWPPGFDSPAAKPLLQSVGELLEQNQIALAQIVIAATESVREDLLAIGGFHRLADLAYLTLERSNFPNFANRHTLEFWPHADQSQQRLENVIKQSYVGTLDCPELNDLRSPAEVIDGYKVQGVFNPQNWFLVRCEHQDVGVLILAEHQPGENCELVYMGVIPNARGRGFGEQIVRFAIERAKQMNVERLVLAVDERNSPAFELYRRLGFVMWDRRTVYARLRGRGV
jgi:ribosomal protein S18 acetylase RimI-like enzyme